MVRLPRGSTGTDTTAADEKNLVYGFNSTSWNSLVPWCATTTNSWIIQRALYEPLIQGGETEMVYCAAESIDVLEDGNFWEIHLNHDVKWHDGTASSAEDWVRTLETITDPDFGTYAKSSSFSKRLFIIFSRVNE